MSPFLISSSATLSFTDISSSKKSKPSLRVDTMRAQVQHVCQRNFDGELQNEDTHVAAVHDGTTWWPSTFQTRVPHRCFDLITPEYSVSSPPSSAF